MIKTAKTPKFYFQGFSHMPDSAALHAEQLKKRIQTIIVGWKIVEPNVIDELTVSYQKAIQETYLTGVTKMYFALFLLFAAPERTEEAVQLMKVCTIFCQTLTLDLKKFFLGRSSVDTSEVGICFEISSKAHSPNDI